MRDDGGSLLLLFRFRFGGYWAFWLGLCKDLGERKEMKRKRKEGEGVYFCRAVLVLVLKGGGGVQWLGVECWSGWLFGLGGMGGWMGGYVLEEEEGTGEGGMGMRWS
jgi:hypothetical protein